MIKSHLSEHRPSIGHWDQEAVLLTTVKCCETISLCASCIRPSEGMCRGGVLRGSTLGGHPLKGFFLFQCLYCALKNSAPFCELYIATLGLLYFSLFYATDELDLLQVDSGHQLLMLLQFCSS